MMSAWLPPLARGMSLWLEYHSWREIRIADKQDSMVLLCLSTAPYLEQAILAGLLSSLIPNMHE